MQTSLARRQRHRRNGSRGHGGGGRAASGIAIAIPLLLFATFVVLAIAGASVAIGAYGYFSQGLDDPKILLDKLDFTEQTVVLDRTGKVELARFGQQKRDVVTFDQIPSVVIDATTSIEDHTFWDNAGFDPVGIVSAALDTLSGRGRGASTITQQLVRARLLPTSAFATTTADRKIKEIIQSIRLTQEFPGADGKKAIITAYLNQNFYGNQSYGIKAAALSYFGVSDLSKLTLAQAAILAAIPQSPTAFDLVKNAQETCTVTVPDNSTCAAAGGKIQLVVPAETNGQPTPIVARRNKVLEAMQNPGNMRQTGLGKYTAADFAAAMAVPVVLTPPQTANWLAPQFVWQVRHQLGSILCGEAQADSCEKVDTGGYTVLTTLDWTLQQKAEKWVKAAAIAPNKPNPAAYLKTIKVPNQAWIQNLHGRGIYNAALGAVDYRTGQIMAYVGSGSYYEPPRGKKFQPQFDVLGDGWRQTGSSFKAINYLTGIEDHTLTAATLLMDVVTNFGGTPAYTPGDADLMERGPLRVRQAIQMSLNIPAIKSAAISGPDHIFAFAQKLGIQWQSKKNPAGVSIGIGTLELHYIDLISAYGAIANGGVLMPRTAILSVADSQGNKIWPTVPAAGKQAISAQGAWIMTDILSSNTDPKQNPWWALRAIYDGSKRRPATLKTGTTNQEIDLAAMGYVAPPKDPKAPALVVGTWMGNSDNSAPPNGTVALETAASLWQAFLTDATKGTPIASFTPPKGVSQVTIDANSGMLPGPFTQRTIKEWFINGTAPKNVDDTKVAVNIDQATGLLWRAGCTGPEVTKGFLDLSNVDSARPSSWQKADQGWIARARRGPGVRGGPKNTPTTYFHMNGFFPVGATWGAPFAPTKVCTALPPPPTLPPLPSDSGGPPPSIQPSASP